MKKKIKKKYKCKSCGYETNILTLGDIHIGCANCGSQEGFAEYKTKDTERLNRFLITGN